MACVVLVRRRSILCYVACGRFDAYWEFNLNAWDTAAGVLLVQEAGGKVTDFTGGPFNIDSREVLGSNGLLHSELLKEFQEIIAGRVEGLLRWPNHFSRERCADFSGI